MGSTERKKLILRCAALAALSLSLFAVLRDTRSADVRLVSPSSLQTIENDIVSARNEPTSPLVIAAERIVGDKAAPEVAFTVTNVVNKTIRAFAIKFEQQGANRTVTTVSINNLDLSSAELPANQSLSQFGTYDRVSEGQQQLLLSVDYVEFADGDTWGPDSARSAERIGGQRAAAERLTKHLIQLMRSGNSESVQNTIETGSLQLEQPSDLSEDWKDGFSLGQTAVLQRLRRAQRAGGLNLVNSELSQLAERFKGGS